MIDHAHVIAFSGKIGSGKSSISREVAARLDWPRVGFGDHVRSLASQRGLDATDRDVLQELGARLVESDAQAFCNGVLAQAAKWKPGSPLVIDGIRHVSIVRVLSELVVPASLHLVHVEVSAALRDGRMAGSTPVEELRRWDAHRMELEACTSLPELAELLLDGARPVPQLVQQTLSWIGSISTHGG